MPNPSRCLRLLSPLALLFACGESTDSSGTDSQDTASDTDTGNDTGSTSGLRTLDNCASTIGTNVPEPFASWFDCADWDVDDTFLSVHTVNLPPHPSPYYDESNPNYVPFDDQGGERFQNPNSLSTQDFTGRIPLSPTPRGLTITASMVNESAGDNEYEYRASFQGIGLDGVALFTGVAAPGDALADEELTFDQYEGHPQNTGVYHHHGPNPSALAVLLNRGVVTTTSPDSAELEFYGVMCDGTVVLGCNELDGGSVTSEMLDAQNGHQSGILGPDGTLLFANRYHVHACAALGRSYTPEIQYYDDGTCI